MKKKQFDAVQNTINTLTGVSDHKETATPKQIETPETVPEEIKKAIQKTIDVKPKENTELLTKRVQLLVRPGTYRKLKQQADALNLSFNNFINQILESYID